MLDADALRVFGQIPCHENTAVVVTPDACELV
jgi:NAD(P)H-hydrate repair Nnr-like enzyme with NAD(P)H-hydrate dehydratase domain